MPDEIKMTTKKRDALELLRWVYDNMGSTAWCAMREKDGADEWSDETKAILKEGSGK